MYGDRKGGFEKRSFNREPTEITCAKCGKKDTVPFKPREGSEVLCKECFLKGKGITPREKKEEPAEESAEEHEADVSEAEDDKEELEESEESEEI